MQHKCREYKWANLTEHLKERYQYRVSLHLLASRTNSPGQYISIYTHTCLYRLVYPSKAFLYRTSSIVIPLLSAGIYLGLSPASHTPVHITVQRYSDGSDGHISFSTEENYRSRMEIPTRAAIPPRSKGISMILTSTNDNKLNAIRLTRSWTVYVITSVSNDTCVSIFAFI